METMTQAYRNLFPIRSLIYDPLHIIPDFTYLYKAIRTLI